MGNKVDLDAEGERVVSYEAGEGLAEGLGIDFIEASAKDDTNVDECFQKMAECILLSHTDGVFFPFFFFPFFFLFSFFFFFFFFFFFLFFFFFFFFFFFLDKEDFIDFFLFFFNSIKRRTYILHVRIVVRMLYLVCWPKRLTWKQGIL